MIKAGNVILVVRYEPDDFARLRYMQGGRSLTLSYDLWREEATEKVH
jgi:hypothetical protein